MVMHTWPAGVAGGALQRSISSHCTSDHWLRSILSGHDDHNDVGDHEDDGDDHGDVGDHNYNDGFGSVMIKIYILRNAVYPVLNREGQNLNKFE